MLSFVSKCLYQHHKSHCGIIIDRGFSLSCWHFRAMPFHIAGYNRNSSLLIVFRVLCMLNLKQTTARARVRALFLWLHSSVLALSMGAALWQSYRVHRSIKETHPPENAPLPVPAPRVSIILPVRNEQANIDSCLTSLLAQDYPDFTVTVIDDGSTDATPCLLEQWRACDRRLTIHRIDELPEGWAGKAHALHTGVTQTCGEWILFTDADTRHAPHTLSLMMGHALRQDVDLLSMRTYLMTLSGSAAPILMPMSEIILAQLMTPSQIRDTAFPHAFAFGQYILIRREAYVASGGYAAASMRRTSVDDVAMAEHIKWNGGQVDVVNGRGLIANRQWTTWKSALHGWRKSTYGELSRSHFPLTGVLGGLALLVYGLEPLITLLSALCARKKHGISTLLAGITLIAQIEAKGRFDREYELTFPWALTAPAGWAIFGVLVIDIALHILSGRGIDWKGRRLPRQKRIFPGRIKDG